MEQTKTIYVYKDELFVGNLYVDYIRGEETYSFEYDETYLSNIDNLKIDINLPLYKGRQYSNNGLFGIFEDSSPDRWGRTLIQRKEDILANKENRKPKKFYESDYLLGVNDYTRMGNLRFKLYKEKEFLSYDKNFSVPPFTSLRTLEEASRKFEEGSLINDKWINQLIKPGSSLGGARPKANVIDTNNELWIAKFPSKNDEYDVGAFEKVVNDLALMCNLNVPESKLEKFSDLGSTFLVKRFDRQKEKRVGTTSAMSLLNKKDGESSSSSYLDLVNIIKTNGSDINDDLIELYKRLIFNMAISNTDDHLRNHSFIIDKHGYRLSPLYDINPIYYGDRLSLNINEYDNSISIDLLLEVSKYFNINQTKANEYIDEIISIVSNNWEKLSHKYLINKNQIKLMRPAFSFKR